MAKLFDNLRQRLREAREFVSRDVWNFGDPDSRAPVSFIARQTRVLVVLFQGLGRDMLLLRAAALGFATIFGLVPFLAIVFFVIDTFNVNEEVYGRLYGTLRRVVVEEALPPGELPPDLSGTTLPERPLTDQFLSFWFQGVAQDDELGDEALRDPVEIIVAAVERADPKSLGLAGFVFLLTTVFGLMQNIEGSFNTIWGLRRTRPWRRMVGDYLVFLIVLPFFAAAALSIPALLDSDLRAHMPLALVLALRASKYGLVWGAFSALYFVVPNTRVRLRYALLAGIVAGTAWIVLSAAYVNFQFGLARYGLIYAAFAQIPVFLSWVYLSWLVLLIGAELTFAYQNEETFAMERYAKGASHAYREALALRAMLAVAERFDQGAAPLRPEEAAREWNVPARLVNDTLDLLERANLVRASGREELSYQPARSLDKVRVRDVVDAVRQAGRDPSGLLHDPEYGSLFEQAATRRGPIDDATLRELVREKARPEASDDAAPE